MITDHAPVHAHMHTDMYTQTEEQSYIHIHKDYMHACTWAHIHTYKHYAYIHILPSIREHTCAHLHENVTDIRLVITICYDHF